MPPDETTVSPPTEGGAQTTPETTTPSTTPSPEGAVYDGLGNDFDDLDATVALPSESEAGGKDAKEPAQVEAKAPESVPPEPVKAAPAPAPPAEGPKETPPPPPSQPSAAVSPPSEPRTLVEQLGQHRAEIITELAKTRFAWDAGESKQFTEELETDATKALLDWTPKMMSRIYYEATTAALNHINQFVPVLMANYTKALDQQKAAETAFFGQFPQLSKDKHWNDILQFAGVFGKQPNISQEDLLAMVGAAVMAKNKLVNAQASNGGVPPPLRKPSAPAFVPAQGGSTPVRVTTEPESPYGGLGGDYED